ncbi:UDP-2,4-diacetamido-2,4,6-trideoxy-beta-L-altropyranose hydrolase [Vibrio sinaloensis]|uniref:Glycosyl transferase family 28 n=1 Tax=Photobacterium sp. (strain ATCC 43367) TaxID=379097 RepID=A0A0A5HSG1_PHOS4|nr:UDP-2,4-diacetamido-2,4,6-trideoxy-beta-L-altropyranose hydrolase [Vibrio sinaloensis]KGY07250.1 glycosyl transferase family 28 [Vibrio sinaloensis]
MLVGIRVDASLKMGTGHTYRMLTLANGLKAKGHDVFFISRKVQGNLISLIQQSFDVLTLPEPEAHTGLSNHCAHAQWLEVSYEKEINDVNKLLSQHLKVENREYVDWLIVDHYAVEEKWHDELKHLYIKLLQVDDLADRRHKANVILDQNYYIEGSARYKDRVTQDTTLLCGPKYALLRNEFAETRASLSSYDERLTNKRVVVFFGGIDLANETVKALEGLLAAGTDDHFDVVIGANNPHRDQVQALCDSNSSRVSLHIQISDIVSLFAKSYLYVGAVGATTWERCIVALPGLVCSVAENQTQVAQDLHEIGGHHYLGQNNKLTSEDYRRSYIKTKSDRDSLHKQSICCGEIVDGLGCNRVIETLE